MDDPPSPRSLLQLADLATPMAIRVAATLGSRTALEFGAAQGRSNRGSRS